MPRTKKATEEAIVEATMEAPPETAAVAQEKPKRTRKPRAKKEAAPAAEKVKEAVKKTVTRKPRKKAVVPSFVIQNSAEDGITYEDVVAKVQAAITGADVTSLDIYVKAEEGKAYYVVNGEAAGAVDLF